MDVKYHQVKPFRFSPAMAWLITYADGEQEIMLLTADSGLEDSGDFALRIAKNYAEERPFTIQNVTVGTMCASLVQDHHQLFFGDSRKIDSEGMVQV